MKDEERTGGICPYYHHAIELIGRRWTGAILLALSQGAERFCALTAAVPGLSDRMLSERLKELEMEGIVQRTVIPTTPVTITYQLTEKGQALRGAMDAIGRWAQEWHTPKTACADEASECDADAAYHWETARP
ncbi:MAG: helix-turn-helix transcriptional regulator [Thermomicrobia bacterium]|nr:helix-turn-helix transcriptional regulator [Thermomicrobia bacterium]